MRIVDFIELRTLSNEEEAINFFSIISNKYEWLLNKDFYILPLIEASIRTADYLDIKSALIKPWKSFDNPRSIGILFLLNCLTGEDLIIPLRKALDSLQNSKPWLLELANLLQILPLTYELAIAVAKLIHQYEPITIKINPGDDFYRRLRLFIGLNHSWLDNLKKWPQGLILAGAGIVTILHKEKYSSNGGLDFYVINDRSIFEKSLKFLSKGGEASYQIKGLMIRIYPESSKKLKLIYIYNLSLSHLMVYFDGHQIHFTPESYVIWKNKFKFNDHDLKSYNFSKTSLQMDNCPDIEKILNTYKHYAFSLDEPEFLIYMALFNSIR